MHGVLTQLETVQGIGGVGGDGSDRVGRINVFARGYLVVLGKIGGNGVFQELSNGGELLVATGIGFR